MPALVRAATAADLPAVLDLLTQLSSGVSPAQATTQPPAWALETFKRVQADKEQQLLVITDEGHIVGTLVLLIVPSLAHGGRPWAEVEHVVVDETRRGKGYGEQLMRHAERLAQAAHCYKLQLQSSNPRVRAHRFYEGLGYTSLSRAFRKYF